MQTFNNCSVGHHGNHWQVGLKIVTVTESVNLGREDLVVYEKGGRLLGNSCADPPIHRWRVGLFTQQSLWCRTHHFRHSPFPASFSPQSSSFVHLTTVTSPHPFSHSPLPSSLFPQSPPAPLSPQSLPPSLTHSPLPASLSPQSHPLTSDFSFPHSPLPASISSQSHQKHPFPIVPSFIPLHTVPSLIPSPHSPHLIPFPTVPFLHPFPHSPLPSSLSTQSPRSSLSPQSPSFIPFHTVPCLHPFPHSPLPHPFPTVPFLHPLPHSPLPHPFPTVPFLHPLPHSRLPHPFPTVSSQYPFHHTPLPSSPSVLHSPLPPPLFIMFTSCNEHVAVYVELAKTHSLVKLRCASGHWHWPHPHPHPQPPQPPLTPHPHLPHSHFLPWEPWQSGQSVRSVLWTADVGFFNHWSIRHGAWPILTVSAWSEGVPPNRVWLCSKTFLQLLLPQSSFLQSSFLQPCQCCGRQELCLSAWPTYNLENTAPQEIDFTGISNSRLVQLMCQLVFLHALLRSEWGWARVCHAGSVLFIRSPKYSTETRVESLTSRSKTIC